MDNASTHDGDPRRSDRWRGPHQPPLAVRIAPRSVDSSPALRVLPFVLSVIAGCTDVISFLRLGGLFTAHITGNLVILAAHVIGGEPAQAALMLSVPVFVAALALTRLLAAGLRSMGLASLLPLLLLQFLLRRAFLPSASPPARASTRVRRMRFSPVCWASRQWRCRTRSCRSR